MNITRHNYEEYFLLYVDNELPPEDRKAVEAFVLLYPDLEEELAMLQQSVLKPGKPVLFDQKETLLKKTAAENPVNASNYSEYFVLYADDELNREEKDLVAQFIYHHPQYQAEFELLQSIKLQPEPHIVFPDKDALYRSEDDDKVVPFRWWRVGAAAAVLLLIAGSVFYALRQPATAPAGIARTEHSDPGQKNRPANRSAAPQAPLPSLARTGEKPGQEQPVSPGGKKEDPLQSGKDRDQHLLAVQEAARKKNISITRNLIPSPAVTHSKPVTASAPANEVNTGEVIPEKTPAETLTAADLPQYPKKPVKAAETSYPDNGADQALTNTYAVNNNSNQIELLNTTVSKKNKLRGLFRKVSRVFEKTTNIGPDNNDTKGIHIANFEIALK